MVVPVYVLSCCGRFAAYVGGAFPLTSPQRPSEEKAWPHPSALPPLADHRDSQLSRHAGCCRIHKISYTCI